jgi:UDP-GlcNAc:undecaprenyl-phosphate GlcNAc-1-phosphate transferase
MVSTEPGLSAWVSAGLAAATSAVCVGLLLPVLKRRILDSPNARSSHDVPTPRGGGLGVAAGTVAGLVVAGGDAQLPAAGLAACALLAILGLADDVLTLSIRVRLVLQLVASVTLVASLDLGEEGLAAVLRLTLLVVVVTGFVNAMNFMDGINAISGLTTVVACGWYVYLGGTTADEQLGAAAAVTCGATLGFLVWNAPGKVFLGDVGSYLLGGLLVLFALRSWESGASAVVAAAPLVLYTFDTAFSLLRRVRAGHTVGEAHRDHVYQRLVVGGLSHVQSALLVAAVIAAICVLAYGFDAGALWMKAAASAGVIVMLAGYVRLPAVVHRSRGTT